MEINLHFYRNSNLFYYDSQEIIQLKQQLQNYRNNNKRLSHYLQSLVSVSVVLPFLLPEIAFQQQH